MTDDIVTKLRYRARVCNHGRHPNAPDGAEVYVTVPCDRCEPLIQAADEIERLQAENDGLCIRIYTLLKKLEQQAARRGF